MEKQGRADVYSPACHFLFPFPVPQAVPARAAGCWRHGHVPLRIVEREDTGMMGRWHITQGMETIFVEDPDGMRHSLLLFTRRGHKSIKEYGNLPEIRKSGDETGCTLSSSVALPVFSLNSLICLWIYPSVGAGTPLERKFAFRILPGCPGKMTVR